ncbi:deoxyribodipyrimidine photo-lyase [Vibrio viridaestus]|uniref:Deoxyribodipyrimidine photo-lyase n=1 Tax=Vibrio viridaestus TaxID=2487322 RepID=A0A3N9TKP4_9VIBR|nr:deoxyribodipyrimidine photo-lyase [Vibrio viridaestus]RQW64919.1 deoxyribodipyrimidine photo-lyase [Vibrio viridaestus]
MNLVWLRTDLRTVDNTALNSAMATGEPTLAIFIATPGQWKQHDKSEIQADLIYRRLFELKGELLDLNVPLLYQEVDSFSDSIDVVHRVVKDFEVKQLYFNNEYELNERRRDAEIEQTFEQDDIDIHRYDDKCLLAPGAVLNKQGDYFKVFTPFKNSWLKLAYTPEIKKLAAGKPYALNEKQKAWLLSESSSFTYPRISSAQWGVKFDEIRSVLRRFCKESIRQYHQNRDFPAIDGTSQLSPYLAIGAISVRQCLARVNMSFPDGQPDGAATWISELIWREFYQHLVWFRDDISIGKSFHDWGQWLHWHENEEFFEKWASGETGYPIVDAAMRQLNQTGWMHNRLRMIVASFLTKDLHINWRKGESYFMSKLIDGDFPANNGGWQWCASTGCDGQPYFRIFNPITQGQKFDPNGEFIKRWVPELGPVPSKFIHEPWKWAGVKNLSYPEQIVDHSKERKLTLELYKAAKDSIA